MAYRVCDICKVDEAALLLPKRVDHLDLAVLAKVIPQFLDRVLVKVLDVAHLSS